MKTHQELELRAKRIMYFLKENNIKLDCYSVKGSGKATENCDIAIDCYLTKDKINLLTQENFGINSESVILVESNPYNIQDSSNKMEALSRIAITLN